MPPTGPRHAATIHRLAMLLTLRLAAAGDMYDVRTENPIGRTDDDEPEPDLAVVGTGDYEHDHPGPADIVLVVEVSRHVPTRRSPPTGARWPSTPRSAIPEA